MTADHVSEPEEYWLSRPAFWLIGILFLLLAFCQQPTFERNPELAMTRQRGYSAAVEQLVKQKCLLPKEVNKAGREIITFTKAAGCPSQAVFESYSNKTFLAGDLLALVRQRWIIDRAAATPQLERLRPSAHLIRFSAEREAAWRGLITYAAKHQSPHSGRLVWASTEGGSPPRDCPNRRIDGVISDQPGEPRAFVSLGTFVSCGSRVWQAVERIEVISETTGSAERTREPTLASVARRIEVGSEQVADARIESSIWYELHKETQLVLEKHLERAVTSGRSEKTIRAAILLMDGRTGEIRAAATHPVRPSRADLGSWWTKNWNFEQLPVGSTAKIPFAVAISQANPSYLERISPPSLSGRASAICGKNANCLGRLSNKNGTSFTKFIAVSSNSHALWLLDEARRGKANGRDKAPGWEDIFRQVACVEPGTGGPSLEQDYGCSGYLWRTAKNAKLGSAEPVLTLKMDPNVSVDPYFNYYINILGGLRSQWTTANLAQAYARIFSNSAVNPRLTARLRLEEKEGKPRSIGLSKSVWTNVLIGMKQALQSGTASELCKSIPCEDGNRVGQVRLYAKTGTATIGRDEDARMLVIVAAKTRDGADPESWSAITDLKIIVITQRYENEKGSAAERSNAIVLAQKLFKNPTFRAWLQ
jgi:hypothetical protein